MYRRYPRLVRIIITIGPSVVLWALVIWAAQFLMHLFQAVTR